MDLLFLPFSPQLEEREAFSKGVIGKDTRARIASGAEGNEGVNAKRF